MDFQGLVNTPTPIPLEITKLIWNFTDEIADICHSLIPGGSLTSIQWLVGTFNVSLEDFSHLYHGKDTLFYDAILFGHLNILKWLTEKYNLKKSDACGGRGFAICTAAKHGYLDVIKWLVERFELGDQQLNIAYHSAADGGHLDVVKYFTGMRCVSGTQKWSNDEIKIVACAAGHGRLNIVKFMVKHFCMDHWVARRIFMSAYRNRQMHVMDWLAHQFPEMMFNYEDRERRHDYF